MMGNRVVRHGVTRGSRGAVALVVAGLLTGCEEVPELGVGGDGAQPSAVSTTTAAGADIAAPEIFQTSEPGLWDGRPSLGGVWVAHPDVADPERVRILNTGNGQQVIGALFRRERDLPGPALQVSSDAAEALGMLAGAPANLEVTALRRQEAPAPASADTAPVPVAPVGAAPAQAAAPVTTSATPVAQATPAAQASPAAPADPAAVQAVAQSLEAIFSASPEPELPQPVTAYTAAAAAGRAGIATSTLGPDGAPAASGSNLRNPFVQLGSFEVEAFVNETAQGLRAKGLPVQIVPVQGTAAWRLLLGPAETAEQQRDLLSRAVAEGFADAYLVRS